MTRSGFSIFICVIGFLALTGCNPRALPGIRDAVRSLDEQTTRATDEAISKSADLKSLDNLCNSIPKLDDYRLYSKRLGHREPLTLFYFYQSIEPFDSAHQRFLSYFSERQWKYREIGSMNKVAEFTNDESRITIQHGGMGRNANYGFSCERKSK